MIAHTSIVIRNELFNLFRLVSSSKQMQFRPNLLEIYMFYDGKQILGNSQQTGINYSQRLPLEALFKVCGDLMLQITVNKCRFIGFKSLYMLHDSFTLPLYSG